MIRHRLVAGALLSLALVAGCGSGQAVPDGTAGPGAVTVPGATATPVSVTAAPLHEAPAAKARDPYVRLARTLHADGVQVWFEADLVKAWLAGPAAFTTAVQRLGLLARSVPVAGFKVADEIGYGDGLTSAAQARAFLRAVRQGLGRVAPGKAVLVDAVVPDLGCLPWLGGAPLACAQQARQHYPAADEAAVSSYLHAGLIDRLDLSTGLLDESTYAGWGLSRDQAQQEVWQHVLAAGWDRLTWLQSRKALAAPGGYQGDARAAAADVRTYLDLPLAHGAHAVDVWTWRQPYDGATVSLLGPGLRTNPLWTDLRARHDAGAVLFTHMTPSAMPTAPGPFARECAVAAQAFDAVFVAAGTG